MAKRPVVVPQFATDAPVGGIVEPIEAVRNAGFATADRPPAQWVNWQFHHTGMWLDFLRGPNASNWTRVEMPAATTEINRGHSADNDTPESTDGIYRLLAVRDGTGLAISYSGHEWVPLTLNPIVGTLGAPIRTFWTGVPTSRWLLATDMGAGVGKVWTSAGSGVAGSALGSLQNGPAAWTATTIPASFGLVRKFASGESGVDVMISTTKIAFSAGSSTFTEATLSGAPGGNFVDVIWSGTAWIAVTDTGEIFRTTTAAGTWTEIVPTLVSDTWCLATDGVTIAAAPHGDAEGTDWYTSDDHGVTWDSMDGPVGVSLIRTLNYLDGVWWLGLATAPYVLVANEIDPDQWQRLSVPRYADTSDVSEIVLCQGALVVTFGEYSLVSLAAQDTAPGPWTPTNSPALLHDAAYLRGTLIEEAGPADGDSLTYNESTEQLEWSPAGGAGISVANMMSALTVACATTANITLSGEQTIDGVLTAASRVLVKNQSTPAQNGIYISAAGAWSRASDASDGTELITGRLVVVQDGTLGIGTIWTLTTTGVITVGVTALTFENQVVNTHKAQTIAAVKTFAANVIIDSVAATGGDTEVNSPDLILRGAYWGGAVSVDFDVKVRAEVVSDDPSGGITATIGDDPLIHVGSYPVADPPPVRAILGDRTGVDTYPIALFAGNSNADFVGSAIEFDQAADFAIAKNASGAVGTLNATILAVIRGADSRIEWSIGESHFRTAIADTNHTVGIEEFRIAYTSLTATRTVTLPPVADAGEGGTHEVVDETGDAAVYPIVIDGDGAELINGSTTYALNTGFGCVKLICTGTAWIAARG